MRRAVLVALLAAAPAHAEDLPSASVVSSAKVVAIAGGGEVDKALLVGPSGQVYEPEPESGGWVRRQAGGVAADVSGAAQIGQELVVTGRAMPMYRRDGDTWFALRLGEEGRTVMGRGPAPAVAIGKQVFVHKGKGKGAWTRVASLPARATQVWAAGAKSVWAATDTALYRLRGSSFSKVGDSPIALAGGGAPWAIRATGVEALEKSRTIPAELDGATVSVVAAAGGPDDDALHVVVDAGGTLVLARTGKSKLEKLEDLPSTGAVAAMMVDGDGDVLVAFADGAVAIRAAKGGWRTASVSDDLPQGSPGPRPSRSQ